MARAFKVGREADAMAPSEAPAPERRKRRDGKENGLSELEIEG